MSGVVPRVGDPSKSVTVYWRPGCPYCASLRRGLRRAGLATTEVNIWSDRAGAATVRRLAGGNETVPTVVVGDVSMVNPSAARVLAAVSGSAQLSLAGPATPRRTTGLIVQVVQWVVVVALVAASFALDHAGHAGVSWALDAAAVLVYLAARVLRRHVDQGGAQ